MPTFLAAVLLARIYLRAGTLRFLHVIPRSRWLSLASGVFIAYFFLHLLPELEEGQNDAGKCDPVNHAKRMK